MDQIVFNMPDVLESEYKASTSDLINEYINRHNIDDCIMDVADTVLCIQDSKEMQREDLVFAMRMLGRTLVDSLNCIDSDNESYSAEIGMMALEGVLRQFFLVQNEETKFILLQNVIDILLQNVIEILGTPRDEKA